MDEKMAKLTPEQRARVALFEDLWGRVKADIPKEPGQAQNEAASIAYDVLLRTLVLFARSCALTDLQMFTDLAEAQRQLGHVFEARHVAGAGLN